jgi:sugar lactone lactonase YvrE
MRPYDYCAVASDTGIYWVDINNKAVVAADSQKAINFSEAVNVQNILNNNISQNIPRVDYDIQNNELICKCLNNEE